MNQFIVDSLVLLRENKMHVDRHDNKPYFEFLKFKFKNSNTSEPLMDRNIMKMIQKMELLNENLFSIPNPN